MEISDKELVQVTGGAVKYGVWIGVGGVITLLIGIIDGFLRPLKCHL